MKIAMPRTKRGRHSQRHRMFPSWMKAAVQPENWACGAQRRMASAVLGAVSKSLSADAYRATQGVMEMGHAREGRRINKAVGTSYLQEAAKQGCGQGKSPASEHP